MTELKLKPGWKVWRFDQMAENIGERADPRPEDSELYVGLEHMETDSLRVRRWGSKTDLIGQKLKMRKGDILFARRNAYLKRVAIAPHDGLFSAHGMVLRAKLGVVLPEFLPFFMQSDPFMDRAIQISVGSLSPTINWKTLAVQEFALPPLDEQQRIIELICQIDEAVDSYLDALARHEALRRSTLDSMIEGGDDSLPHGWNKQFLGEICDLINGYGFKPQDWCEEGVPIIRIQNLNGAQQFNYFKGRVDEKYSVAPGDLLFAWAGVPGVSFGARIWPGPQALLNQHIFRVVPKPGFNQRWLFEVLNHITPSIERRAHGFKTSLLHIKRSELVKMNVKVPTLEVQEQIATVSEKLELGRTCMEARLGQLRQLRGLVMVTSGDS